MFVQPGSRRRWRVTRRRVRRAVDAQHGPPDGCALWYSVSFNARCRHSCGLSTIDAAEQRPRFALTTPSGGRPGARLRVATVVPGGVDRSGTERVIPCLLWLIERLAREVELHVVALRQEPQPATYPLLGATVHCLAPGATRVRKFGELLNLQRRFGFDLWHAVWMHPQGTLAAAAGLFTRRPVLLHLNGGDLTRLPGIRYGGRATTRGRLWLRAAVAGASRVTVPSESMRRAAAALGITAEVATYGVDVGRWPPGKPRARAPGAPANMLHVASLNPVKDQATLLRALAVLRERGIAFRMDIIGEDTVGGRVQRRAAELGLGDIVRFHGWLPHAATRTFHDAAHVLLVSSLHEADPIVALEAAIAGVPTVGTAVGHLADWAPAAAITVGVGDAEALAEATAALIEDDVRRQDLARNAQRLALAMDADAGAARVLEIYRALVSRPARGP